MWWKSWGVRGRLVAGVGGAVVLAAAVFWFLFPPGRSVAAGPFADDPRCAEVVADAPDTLLGEDRDRVTSTGAAAWGDGAVVLRCGVRPPSPTTDLCMNVDGVDWVLDETRAERDGVKVLTTYGRSPAVEVTLSGGSTGAGGVLAVLDRAVRQLPQESRCLSLGDVG